MSKARGLVESVGEFTSL
uniref:Uncharacterized protein n=1 Tax=Rhizophora mucronata TaxID=61149 RepID=A0A2P2P2I2_RHIMU